MENKNEFDDLILEKNNKSEKIKKILLRIIALVVLFLVVMVVMKLINTSSTEEAENAIPEEPVLELNTEKNDVINIGNDPAELEFEMIKNSLQGEDNKAENNNSVLEENITKTDVFVLPEANKSSEVIIEQEQIIQKEPVINNNNEIKKEQTNPSKQDVKKQTSSTNDLFKNIGNSKITSSGLVPGIYIQIFSVSNLDQKSKELLSVKNKGYDYKLYKTMVNGKEVHKVLVGPFKKEEIKSELEKIRANIAKGAFTFIVK